MLLLYPPWNTHTQNHRLRASPIFIAAGRTKHIHKFDLTRYPWTSTTYTHYLTVTPPHVMLMPEIESLKDTFKQYTRNIFQEMRNELNERNVGGYLHESGCVLDKKKWPMNNSYQNFIFCW